LQLLCVKVFCEDFAFHFFHTQKFFTTHGRSVIELFF
jgi:hypothetical protein